MIKFMINFLTIFSTIYSKVLISKKNIPREWINMTVSSETKTLDLKTKNIRFSILAASQQCRRSIVNNIFIC